MKSILAIFLLVAICSGRLLYSHHSTETMPEGKQTPSHNQVFKGFLAGMALDSQIDDLLPCFIDLKLVSKDFSTVVTKFKLHTLHGITEGLKYMKKSLKDLPKALFECSSHLKNDYLRVKNSLQVLEYPITIEYE